jgi:hypothetical protein
MKNTYKKFSRLSSFVLAALMGLALAHASKATPIFVNGGFESGFTGWTVFSIPIATNVHVDNQGGPGFDGAHWCFLGGYDCQGYIEQTLTGLTSGTTYAVDFLIASETTRSDTLVLSMTDGSSTPAVQLFAPPSSFTGWRTWVSEEYDFLASATSATVRFSTVASVPGIPSDQQPHYDVGLDGVSIHAVPEHSSSFTLLVLSLLGLAVMRRVANRKNDSRLGHAS